MNPYAALAAAWGSVIFFLGGLVWLSDPDQTHGEASGGPDDPYVNP